MKHPVYRFRSEWTLPMPTEEVYDLLVDIAGYPRWWPQVRAVAKIDDDTAFVLCRSVLPYVLEFEMASTRQDRPSGVLAAELHGDLVGRCRWTMSDSGRGTRLVFEQEVATPGRLLTIASRFARPLLVLNHAWMMRGCRRGMLSAGPAPAGRTTP